MASTTLTLGEAAAHRVWAFLRNIAASPAALAVQAGLARPTLTTGGATYAEPAAILKGLLAGSPGAKLLGATPLEEAEIADALQYSEKAADDAELKALEARLTLRSYVAGARLTAADALALYAAAPVLAATPAKAAGYPQITRWLRTLYVEAAAWSTVEDAPARVQLPARKPLNLAAGGDKPAKEKKEKPAKEAKPAAPPAAAEPEASPLSQMDFGVGQIVEVWKHPDSDKLYCEKIDMGAGEVREIASGLQAHFTLEQMKGQRVVVVRNLKAIKLAGFPSNGMVLCATGPTGKVEFVEPPAGAALGERVAFAGHEGPAAEPNRVAKKKIFDAVAPGLKLDAEGRATWEGIPFMTSAGPCTCATLKGPECPVK